MPDVQPINEVETNKGSVKAAADRIFGLMSQDLKDSQAGDPSKEDETKPVKQSAPVKKGEKDSPKPQQDTPEPDEQETEEPPEEAADSPPTAPQEVVTRFDELADHLGVEDSYLQSLTVPTKVNGVERTPTIKDLISHYQKGEAADVKLMEVAEDRKKFSTEVEKATEQINQEWGRIQALHGELENLLNKDETDLEVLRHSDPAEYTARVADRSIRKEKAEQIRQQLVQTQAQKLLENYTRKVNIERQKLPTEIPEWQDEKTYQTEARQVREYLLSNGFKDEDVDGKMDNGVIVNPGIIESRAIKIIRKAMLYDQSKKGVEPKKTKLTSLPKVTSGQRQTKEDVKAQEKLISRDKLKASGKVEDAAEIIRQIMER